MCFFFLLTLRPLSSTRNDTFFPDTPLFRSLPLQAVFITAATFSAGAIMPLAVFTAASAQQLIPLVVAVSLLCLVLLGALGAKAGGAPVMRSIIRVTFWGALAMALTDRQSVV